jgi:hypothetical protein
MREAAQFDAKAPDRTFDGNGSGPRRKAREESRSLAEEILGDSYRRLEALRTTGRSA